MMGILVTPARSVAFVSTCLSMAKRYNEEMLLQMPVFETGFKAMVTAKGTFTPTHQGIMFTPTKEMGKFSFDSIHVDV